MNMSAHTHMQAHTHTHTHTVPHTHTRIHSSVQSHAHTQMIRDTLHTHKHIYYVHIHSHTHAYNQVCSHAHTCLRFLAHPRTASVQTCTHTQSCTYSAGAPYCMYTHTLSADCCAESRSHTVIYICLSQTHAHSLSYLELCAHTYTRRYVLNMHTPSWTRTHPHHRVYTSDMCVYIHVCVGECMTCVYHV